jgi:hypothetical protein
MTSYLAISYTALLVLSFAVFPAHAATYQVSPQGSDNTPCGQGPRRTINAGLACLSGGDTLIVGGGTYVNDFIEDFGAQPPPPGRSWDAPTTIKAAPGETVWLTATRNSEGGFISLERPGPQYLVFEGLNLDGVRPGGDGVFTYGIGGGASNSHVRYRNMEIKRFRTGVKVDGNFNEFLQLNVHSIGKPACPSEVGCQGMYISGHNNLIANSLLHDNDCMGVQFYKPEGSGPVTGNVIRHTCAYNNGCVGIFAQGGNTITHNLSYNNLVGIQTGGSTILHNIAWNNSSGIGIWPGTSEIKNNISLGQSQDIASDGGTSYNYANNVCGATNAPGTFGCTVAMTPAEVFVNASGGDFRLTPAAQALGVGPGLTQAGCPAGTSTEEPVVGPPPPVPPALPAPRNLRAVTMP